MAGALAAGSTFAAGGLRAAASPVAASPAVLHRHVGPAANPEAKWARTVPSRLWQRTGDKISTQVIPAASINARQYPSQGGALAVRLAGVPARSVCTFTAGAGIRGFSGTFRCGGSVAHVGRVLANTAPVTRRWTVRASVVASGGSRNFAWVVGVAAAPTSEQHPAPAPVTTTTLPPTSSVPGTSTTTVPTTTLPTTTTLPGSGGGGSGGSAGFQPAQRSSNWSGYVLPTASGGVTEVGATWTVPTLNCSATPNGNDADWVGVDGTAGDDNLFQTGVASSCSNGSQVSDAWYEELPATAQFVFAVSPGDTISAEVSQVSPGLWQFVITDETTNVKSNGTYAYGGQELSADWIEEDPATVNGNQESLAPFGDYGSITFSDLTANGSTPVLSAAGAIELVQNGSVVSLPNPPGVDSFSVDYE